MTDPKGMAIVILSDPADGGGVEGSRRVQDIISSGLGSAEGVEKSLS